MDDPFHACHHLLATDISLDAIICLYDASGHVNVTCGHVKNM
jgi:hypothetical protein